MSAKQLCFIALLMAIGCQQSGIGQLKPPAVMTEKTAEAELDRQLKINRDALFQGSSEAIRADAATLMLFSQDTLARKILLGALKQSENRAARAAVCKALSQSRGKPVTNKEEFIKPLIDILATDEPDNAKLAAEAVLIFDYGQVSELLEEIATSPSRPAKIRLNAIGALKLQPDKRAIIRLVKLLDDADSQVAAAAEQALKGLGMPVGEDIETRRQIIEGLASKGRNEFLRDWLISQEAQMNKLKTESNLWKGLYLAAMDKLYDGIDDDVGKGQFLAEHLGSSQEAIKLWALKKAEQWRIGTKSKLPTELEPILVGLVSDENRDVRLKTAKLLSLMGQLNSAEKLLEQLKAEQDDQVQTELFVALGAACHYAFSSNSGTKIPEQIRNQTLELAVKYLSEENAQKAQNGAKVIKKLLEQDGLASVDVERYLGELEKRYKRETGSTDGSLRGELLSAMAGLCVQGSFCKLEAAKLFRPLFEDALGDETDLVREAAADGRIYADKAGELRILRKDSVNDSSIKLRQKLINLAGEVGGEEDLVWLAEKTGLAAERESAWQAMLKIFKDSGADVLNTWLSKFESQNTKARVSDEQWISFLETAERKAVGEDKATMVKDTRKKLAVLYSETGDFEQAAKYLGLLHQKAVTVGEKEAILAHLLDVYLRWPKLGAATQLLNNCLLEKDLGSDNIIVRSIDDYLLQPAATAEPNAVLEALVKINPQERPNWAEQLKRWGKRHGGAKKLHKGGKTAN